MSAYSLRERLLTMLPGLLSATSWHVVVTVLRELSIATATEKTRQDKQREKSAKRERRKQHKLIHGPDDGTYTPEEDPFGLAMDQVENHEHQEP